MMHLGNGDMENYIMSSQYAAHIIALNDSTMIPHRTLHTVNRYM